MKNRQLIGIIICAGSLLNTACTKRPAEPHSEIVGTLEKAGSGDLSSTPVPQIEDWLRKHRDLAVQVDDMCKPAREKADANWATTTEGRVCTGARNASMFYRQYHNPPKPTGDAVGPGY
jgi:hypothetical protein